MPRRTRVDLSGAASRRTSLRASFSDIRETCEGHLPRHPAVLGTDARRGLPWPRAEHSADGGTEPRRDTGQSRAAALAQRVTPRDFTTYGLRDPGRVDKARANHPGRYPRGRRAGLRPETPRSPARNGRRRRMPAGRSCRRPRRLLPLRLLRRGVGSLPQPPTRRGLPTTRATSAIVAGRNAGTSKMKASSTARPVGTDTPAS